MNHFASIRSLSLLFWTCSAGCMVGDDHPPCLGPALDCQREDAGQAGPDAAALPDAGLPELGLPPAARSELIALGAEKYRGKAVIAEEQRAGDAVRVTFDPASGPRCLRGAPYAAFYVDRGAPDTVILLDGGGACWSALCAAEETADEVVRPVGPALDDPSNAFRAWNLVFAPYCDGSVFWGDNQLEEADGRPRYQPQRGETGTTSDRGR